MIVSLLQEIRYAGRLVSRQPRHALLTIITSALGIGATTVLFSVAYGVLVKPLAWPNANRLIVVKETRGGSAPRFGTFTNAAYLAWRDDPATLENIAAWSQRTVTLSGRGDPQRIRITAATASFFPTLGIRPLIGTLFEPKDETSPVIVLSEGLWRERFGANPAALGSLVHLDGQPHAVVGVIPDRLAYPDQQARAIVPFAIRPTDGNYLSMFNVIAVLRPSITAAQAAAEGTARGRLVADTGLTTTAIFGNRGPIAIAAQPLSDALTADLRRPLLVLLAAVGLLLLTATANVANLQLVRMTTRSRELAIRAALGAGSGRVTRQVFVESLVLGLTGGAAGLALTWMLHRVMPSLLPADFPRVHDLAVDLPIVAFALIVSIGTSLIFGSLPALRARRQTVVEALAGDGTMAVASGTRSRSGRARMLIMTAQVATACVLLVGASLLTRSFSAMLHADRGYDPTGILTARLTMPATLYPSQQHRFAIVDEILNRLRILPGVSEAAFTSDLPLAPGGSTSAFNLRSPDAPGGVIRVQASPRIVSRGYFSMMGLRIIAGRPFLENDTETSELVVVVNQSFARSYLGRSPLGSKLPVAAYAPWEDETLEASVIGIVDDVRFITAADTTQPELYYSHRQMRQRLPVETVTLLARGDAPADIVAGALRSMIREADERLVAEPVLPLEERLLTTLARPRLYATLLGSFAAFALAIAAVGLFGVLSYSVSQRSRELAVRVALGARQTDVVRLVLVQGLAVTLVGSAAGMLISTGLTQLLSSQLYGVTRFDPLTFIIVPMVILAAGALACFVPARRAARLDALQVLRRE